MAAKLRKVDLTPFPVVDAVGDEVTDPRGEAVLFEPARQLLVINRWRASEAGVSDDEERCYEAVRDALRDAVRGAHRHALLTEEQHRYLTAKVRGVPVRELSDELVTLRRRVAEAPEVAETE